MVTWMATRQSSSREAEEAIIISGTRKGELIRLSDDEPELTPGETALLDELTRDAQRMAESARARPRRCSRICARPGPGDVGLLERLAELGKALLTTEAELRHLSPMAKSRRRSQYD
jgi:hypothetical protein